MEDPGRTFKDENFRGVPGTGSLGGNPVQHNYKRALVRAPPPSFTVKVLPTRKFGNGYCYGVRVIPILSEIADIPDNRSSKSSFLKTDYEIWRRWDDCLWFQEHMEIEYNSMARAKRSRLAAGKGIKKDGVYIHSDQAASFESLPPGPEANSIAKDVHEIIQKLDRKGTLFRPTQATIDQRQKQWKAMIESLFAEDVPTLVVELRNLRIIRDFFGYWRRDQDHDRKLTEKLTGRPNSSRGLRASIAGSAFSMYFSASNISLQLPGAFDNLPASPSLPSPPLSANSKRRSAESAEMPTASSSSSNSVHSELHTPPSATAGVTFTMSDTGSIAPATSDADSTYGFHPSVPSVPPRSSARWSGSSSKSFPKQEPFSEDESGAFMFIPDDNWADPVTRDARLSGLQVLPEEGDLVPPERAPRSAQLPESLPHPVRRARNNSMPLPDRASNRNCLFFGSPPTPQNPAVAEYDDSSILDGIQDSFHSMDLSDAAGIPKSRQSVSSSPRSSSSAAFSSFSERDSWRTSSASMMSQTSFASIPSMDTPRDSCVDIDRALAPSPIVLHSNIGMNGTLRPSHQSRMSISTLNSVISNSSVDAVLPRRITSPSGSSVQRSLSTGSRRSANMTPQPQPFAVPPEEVWYEQQEELIDAYFYDPTLRTSVDSREDTPNNPSSSISVAGCERNSVVHASEKISTPDRYPKPFQNRPPGQFHVPFSPLSSPSTASFTSSMISASPSSTTHFGTAPSFTIKAVKGETIVLLRASSDMSFAEVRDKIKEKFSSQEGTPLSDDFIVAYAPTAPKSPMKGRPRSNSTSTMGSLSPGAFRQIAAESDWEILAPEFVGKVTFRIFDH